MSETQQDIERHNARELWRDVPNHLTVAREAVEHAQGALSDLDHESYADLLQPIVETLQRASSDAAQASEP